MEKQVDLIPRRLGQPMEKKQPIMMWNRTATSWRKCSSIPVAFGRYRSLLKEGKQKSVTEAPEGFNTGR
jgi:hypothetical protein